MVQKVLDTHLCFPVHQRFHALSGASPHLGTEGTCIGDDERTSEAQSGMQSRHSPAAQVSMQVACTTVTHPDQSHCRRENGAEYL